MMPYLWVKAVHVAAVLLFVGGLFAQALALAGGQRDAAGGRDEGGQKRETGTAALVARWDRRVTVPAMLVVWLTGAAIAADGGWAGSPWLWVKLAFVLALTGLHGIQSGRLRRLLRGNPVPTRGPGLGGVAFIAGAVACIALLVVAKPF